MLKQCCPLKSQSEQWPEMILLKKMRFQTHEHYFAPLASYTTNFLLFEQNTSIVILVLLYIYINRKGVMSNEDGIIFTPRLKV